MCGVLHEHHTYEYLRASYIHAMPVANIEHRPLPWLLCHSSSTRLLHLVLVFPSCSLSAPTATPGAVCQAPGTLAVTGIAACGPRGTTEPISHPVAFPSLSFFVQIPPVSIICSYPLVACRHYSFSQLSGTNKMALGTSTSETRRHH